MCWGDEKELALAECAGMRERPSPPFSFRLSSFYIYIYIRLVAKAGRSGIPLPSVSQYAHDDLRLSLLNIVT